MLSSYSPVLSASSSPPLNNVEPKSESPPPLQLPVEETFPHAFGVDDTSHPRNHPAPRLHILAPDCAQMPEDAAL